MTPEVEVSTHFLETIPGMVVMLAAFIAIVIIAVVVLPKLRLKFKNTEIGSDGNPATDKTQDEKINSILTTLDELKPIIINNAKDVLRVNSKLQENSVQVKCLSACRYLEAGGNGQTAVEYADDYRAGKWDGAPEEKSRLGKLLGLT